MKRIFYIVLAVLSIVLFSSCDVDDYKTYCYSYELVITVDDVEVAYSESGMKYCSLEELNQYCNEQEDRISEIVGTGHRLYAELGATKHKDKSKADCFVSEVIE